MIGVGIDMVDIARMAIAGKRTPRMLQRVFTTEELAYCLGKGNPWASLAARFAAREAFRKVDPSFCHGLSFHDVSVRLDQQGRPNLLLSAAAEKKAQQAGWRGFSLSLSHSRQQAVAVIIGEGGNPI